MKAMIRQSWGFGLSVVFLVCLSVAGYAAENGITTKPEVKAIPCDFQLIAPIGDDVQVPFVDTDMRRWVSWPSEEYIENHLARRDRSQEIPPVYGEADAENAKPKVPGAKSPTGAKREAGNWIETVLESRWIPENLSDRLIPTQRDPASKSAVLCRYEIDGVKIQIVQTRWAMCIVIKPTADVLAGVPSAEVGPTVFKAFLKKGSDMASLPAEELKGEFDSIQVFSRKPGHPYRAVGQWWGWRLWYTDGAGLAVFLKKDDRDGQLIPSPDHPWF